MAKRSKRSARDRTAQAATTKNSPGTASNPAPAAAADSAATIGNPKDTGSTGHADRTGHTGSTGHAGTEIRIQKFSLSAGGKPLLVDANASFPAGKLTLVLGCSGVGKSLLMRILAGLIDKSHPAIQYSGSIEFLKDGQANKYRDHMKEPVAVVFQSFALFDELTPAENIEIAIEHSSLADRSRSVSKQSSRQLLEDLGVPGDRPTSVLSGGQQQRLAIARALGMKTDVVLYDEPTSGLDTNTASQVADLIRDAQTRFQRTSIIVTHDYSALQKIADHVVLLNHHDRTLIDVPREEWSNLPQLLGKPPLVDDTATQQKSLLARAAEAAARASDVTGEFIENVLLLPLALLPIWKSFRWGSRITWHYLKLVSGWSACIYIAISGMIIGFVAQDFIFRYLPFRQYTEPLLIENLLHATGFSLYRFLVPILSTILITARSGAAVSADVGSKVYGNQLDAMKTIGMDPWRTLRTPVLYAFLIGTPLLTFLSYAVASVTAAVAFLATHSNEGIAFWDAHFHKELRLPGTLFYKGTGWLIAKLLTCAVGTAMISWKCS